MNAQTGAAKLELFKTGSIMMPLQSAILSALGDKQTYFSVENEAVKALDIPAFLNGHSFLPQNDNQHSQYVEAKVWQIGLTQDVINRGDRADNFCATLPLVLTQTSTKPVKDLTDAELKEAGYSPRIGRLQLAQQNGNPVPITKAITEFVNSTSANLSEQQVPAMAELVKAQLGLDAVQVKVDEQGQAIAQSIAQLFLQNSDALITDELLQGNVHSYHLAIATPEQLIELGECETQAEAQKKIGQAYKAMASEALRPMSVDSQNFRYELENVLENAYEKLNSLKEKGEKMIEATAAEPAAQDVPEGEHAGNVAISDSITAVR